MKLEYIIILLCVLMAILCVILLFSRIQFKNLYNKYIRLYEQSIQQQRTPQQLEYEAWIHYLEGCYNKAHNEALALKPTLRDAYLKSFYNSIFFLDQPDKLFTLIDEHIDGYFTNLSAEFPNLSLKSKLLVAMYLLKVQDADIILLLNYSPFSLPTIKMRLCKNLGLNHSADLQSFLLERMK